VRKKYSTIACARFHLLGPAFIPHELMHVETSSVSSKQAWPISQGKKVDSDFFAKAHIELSGSIAPDVLGGPLRLYIFSERIYDAISPYTEHECQWIEMKCIARGANQVITYYVFNPLSFVDAAVGINGGPVTLYNLRIDKSKVPDGCNYFRLSSSKNVVLLSDHFLSLMDGANLIGTDIDSFDVV
jgi:hypothetical protein